MSISTRVCAHPLDNVFWNSLCGDHTRYSVGSGEARRYAPGFSAIVGFADPGAPQFAALAPHCHPGESFYCNGWEGEPPSGWKIVTEGKICCLVWDAALAAEVPGQEVVTLDARQSSQAISLAELTRPGPFGRRTLELGEYVGFFEDGHLVAMAGERMHVGAYREISGVCTHPDHQRKGLARLLVAELIRRQRGRDEVPFLHVMAGNAGARRLYEAMGFREHRESTLRVICYQGPG